MRTRKLVPILGAVLLLMAAVAVPRAAADTLTSDFTVSNCTASPFLNCGTTSNFGTVTLTDVTGGVDFSIVMASGWGIIDFAWNWTGTVPGPTITISGASSPWFNGALAFHPSPPLQQDGFGTFNYREAGPTGLSDATTSLSFHVAGYTAADFFGENADGYDFAAHVGSLAGRTAGTCGGAGQVSCTGYVAEPGGETGVIPEPATLLLLGTGLIGLGRAWRKRR